MSDVIAEVPAAGWYQDPNDDLAMRWWDGSGWTDHTQPLAPEPAPTPIVATRTATTEGTAGGAWESNYTDDELALYTGKPTELTSGSTTGRTVLDFSGTVPDWRRDRVTAQTGGAWLLAVSPLLWVIFGVFWTVLGASLSLPAVSPWVAIPIGVVLTLLFAALDHRSLGKRGISRPSLAFILLFPIGYLIARAVTVRRSGASGAGPLVLNILSGLLFGALVVMAVLVPALVGVHAGPDPRTTQQNIEQAIQADLAHQGTEVRVDCSGASVSITPNSSFHCSGTAADGAVSDIVVALDDKGRMSYRVVAAAPTPAATPAAP